MGEFHFGGLWDDDDCLDLSPSKDILWLKSNIPSSILDQINLYLLARKYEGFDKSFELKK